MCIRDRCSGTVTRHSDVKLNVMCDAGSPGTLGTDKLSNDVVVLSHDTVKSC